MKYVLQGLALAMIVVITSAMASSGALAGGLRSWQHLIAKAVASKQVYPRSALRREIEGSAKVRVTVDRSGKIANFEIIQATGHNELDREVPKLMRRIDPLPKPPSEVSDEQLTFVLPLTWVLQ
ncbi:MAG: energy transducer TonB [Rhodothalassiaceae bacterium]